MGRSHKIDSYNNEGDWSSEESKKTLKADESRNKTCLADESRNKKFWWPLKESEAEKRRKKNIFRN